MHVGKPWCGEPGDEVISTDHIVQKKAQLVETSVDSTGSLANLKCRVEGGLYMLNYTCHCACIKHSSITYSTDQIEGITHLHFDA